MDNTECTHHDLVAYGNPTVPQFAVACMNCGDVWDYDSPDLPLGVKLAALPIWTQHGL
ncbi:hypothetical protein GCM10012275_53140 [Longimycelium tulufanense]|uniref:Uncharacterized protein n=1 Tax=Longimycelium tulufanense TaxID=907463 RepID=A0A8J3CCZ3_9PSEU|nr:hypothetical protein [Longimycelium tulufanense]GGM75788.1 hypothetical protein GCM10012275_53140 [Longimycelium tulufanense]